MYLLRIPTLIIIIRWRTIRLGLAKTDAVAVEPTQTLITCTIARPVSGPRQIQYIYPSSKLRRALDNHFGRFLSLQSFN